MIPTLDTMREKLVAAGMWPIRAQADTATEILVDRLNTILPVAMKESGVDFWITASAEYNEDPVMRSLFAWDMPTASRVSAILFHQREDGSVRKMSVRARSVVMEDIYENVLLPGEDAVDCIARIIGECNPNKIGVNSTENGGIGDGMSASLLKRITDKLSDEQKAKVCSSHELVVGYMQRLTEREKSIMATMTQITHDIVDMCFSSAVITLGKTTTTDVEWAMRDAMTALGFGFWFGPDVNLQRRGEPRNVMMTDVIQPGDLIHCDIGLLGMFVKLNTDVQHIQYIPLEGETEAPQGIKNALAAANRLQDIVCETMADGKTGNEVFLTSMEKAKAEGLRATLYTHPLGTYGHGAGPIIGLYNEQKAIPVRGDYKVRNNTGYALELNCCVDVPEWDNQTVFAFMEEDICCANGEVYYFNGRETEVALYK